MSESVPTGRLRLMTSIASTARCLGVRTGTSVPSTLISSGPRTPNPTPAMGNIVTRVDVEQWLKELFKNP